MRFIQTFIFVLAVNILLQIFLPWWIIAATAFAAGILFNNKLLPSFIAGFSSVFLLWVGYAFWLDIGNNQILSSKVALILEPLTGGTSVGILLLTGCTGGLVSGLALLSGSLVKRAFTNS